MTFARCLMFLADGARADCFEELLAQEKLPHIARHIVGRGSYVRGITAFPSTTGPAYMPFLTGCLPGTCNVPGIRWFDKQEYARAGVVPPSWRGRRSHRSYVGIETFRINSDMRPDIATLFSLLPKSYSIFNSVTRGVTGGHNLTRIMRIWYWYYAHLTDRWGFVDAAAAAKTINLSARDFQFGFVVFPGIDEYTHLSHPRHPRVLEAYAMLDRAVGLVAERLQRLRRYDETLLWIVSDHGLSTTQTHFCVNTFLERRGLRTFFYPVIFKRGCVAANMMSGNGMTHLYFRHPNGWEHPVDRAAIDRMAPGLHAALLEQPAVDILATRTGEGAITIESRRGQARLQWSGEQLLYQIDGADPFGYGPLPTAMTPAEQLTQTFATDYPDGLYQLAHIFTAPRTGDIVVSATPGFDLREKYEVPEHKSSHGSLHKDHMLVPIACSAPLTRPMLRTVDVFPTTLQALGRVVPAGIDGSPAN